MLLARFHALGDVLLTLPVAEALAGSPRVAFVDLLTSAQFAADARRAPYLRRVLSYDPVTGVADADLAATAYDVLVDLHTRGVPLDESTERLLAGVKADQVIAYASPYAPAGGTHLLPARQRTEHAVEYYARAVEGLLDGPPGPGRLRIGAAELTEAAARLPDRAVCLAPGARYPWKRWPAESYARLAGRLLDEGRSPVLVGHSFDEPYVRAVLALCPAEVPAIIADTSELATILAAGGTLVANNSGLAALGSAAGARVVCLHSHTLPVMWRPWGPGHVDLVGDPATMPCRCVGGEPHDLATPCGKGIAVAEVVDAVLRLTPSRSSELRAPARSTGIQRTTRPASRVLVRAPLRVSFAGGGTDIMPYAAQHGGCVLSATIDVFVYASIGTPTDRGRRPSPAEAATFDLGRQLLGLPAEPETMDRLHPNPYAGSGLGTSSASVVATLAALAAWYRRPTDPAELARLAYRLEREEMAQPGGAQDHYAAAYGGLNFVEFGAHGEARVSPVYLPGGIRRQLEESLLLCDTGIRRDSGRVLAPQIARMARGDVTATEALHRMRALAVRMRDRLTAGDLSTFGELMGQAWAVKQRLAGGHGPRVAALFAAAQATGAVSGKALGAGGGGFLLFHVPPPRRAAVVAALEAGGGRVRPVRLYPDGVRTVHLPSRARGGGSTT